MTDLTQQQKLEFLIKKAVDNGFYSFMDGAFGDPELVVVPMDRFGQIKVYVKGWLSEYQSAEAILFDHDFAKALFGEEFKPYTIAWYKLEGKHMKDPDEFVAEHHYIKCWEFHSMQAVISPDPINYLYEAIKNNA